MNAYVSCTLKKNREQSIPLAVCQSRQETGLCKKTACKHYGKKPETRDKNATPLAGDSPESSSALLKSPTNGSDDPPALFSDQSKGGTNTMTTDIRLLGMRLRNFKGISSYDIEFSGNDRIFGQNATGKTTLEDGFLWVLFGKDSQNQASFDIKPLDSAGREAHNLEHSVELSMMVNSQLYTIKRVYYERYTKKRGSAKHEFTGHTTDFFFNGVPLKESEYQARIKGIIPENVFRLTTDPRYFNEQLKWQDRRSILMEICGETPAQEIIDSDPSLAGLTGILNGNNIDDVKKMVAAQKKEINEQLEKIPVRIDELRNMIQANQVQGDTSDMTVKIFTLQETKTGLDQKLADLLNGGGISQKRIELSNVQVEVSEKQRKFEQDKTYRIAPLNKALDGIQESARQHRRKIADLEAEIAGKKNSISTKNKLLENIRADWYAVDAQTSTDMTVCPTCKQPIPEIAIQEARAKFNQAKADKLAGIDQEGKAVKAQIDQNTAILTELEDALEALKDQKFDQVEEQHYLDKIKAIREEQYQADPADEQKAAALQNEIDNISQTAQTEIRKVQDEIARVQGEINALQTEINKSENNQKASLRIEELTKEESRLSEEFEKLEQKLFLIENFIRVKVSFLDSKINSKFALARFKLFEDQINGGLQEVCETTVNGVPYSSVNNAARIQAGLDIIKTLQDHYGIKAPIWIDNRESVVEIPQMDCQLISLVVSPGDKALRIERDGTAAKAAA
jgi:DNA repair exonuclease SbcCD ATPase subunit